ncbi:MAG: hypothetical protein CBB92_00300 [Flammeovirgaceae bacterium TMED32]|nr:MAG: hypothetical protein CBB92_02860 [Flammeovirgaceae bacterium TMED32]OUU04366.1 MAG: hypothetical protein CBB92_00300 [Flammeovirgaceae bacterium TMED32]|tara:strand:- start:12119 stop:12796 length:678 start_codon:yes stop_codon:yes gene_type:complete
MILLILISLLLAYAPQLYVRAVFKRYSTPRDNILGSGAELVRHLAQRFEVPVEVKETDAGLDRYDPTAVVIYLSPDNYHGHSLTAVAAATHEFGHAIQFHRQEPTARMTARYLPMAVTIQRIGLGLLSLPFFAIFMQMPRIGVFAIGLVVVVMLMATFVHAIVLPQEWDASFNKALPILQQGEYIAEQDLPAVKSILRAAALTYVAHALSDVFSWWRWGRILRPF